MSAATKKQVCATVGEGLPDDVILLIFLKLPVNSLLRFCSLSKQWNSTIRSSIFANQHINNQMTLGTKSLASSSAAASTSSLIHAYAPPGRQTRRLFATRIVSIGAADDDDDAAAANTCKLAAVNHELTDMINQRRFGYMPIRSYVHISSCNGLLFMCGISYGCSDRVIVKRIMRVVNPATRKYKDLAKVPVEFDQHEFDRFLILGFGYDPSTDDYKVVYSFKVDTAAAAATRITLVLSMKTNTWRQVVNTSPPELSECRPVQLITSKNSTVAFSGNVYWIVFCETTSNPHKVMILQYSLGDERFELVPFPERATDEYVDPNHIVTDNEELFKGCRLTLSNHKGSLYVFVAHYSFSGSPKYKIGEIDLWMLERTKVDATASSSIVFQKVGVIPTVEGTEVDPLGFNCSGHIIMKRLQQFPKRNHMYIYAYLPKQNRFVELCQTESSWSVVHLVQMETLTCP